jgi:hypothetical protein
MVAHQTFEEVSYLHTKCQAFDLRPDTLTGGGDGPGEGHGPMAPRQRLSFSTPKRETPRFESGGPGASQPRVPQIPA